MIKVTTSREDRSLCVEKHFADVQHTAERGWQKLCRWAGPSQQYLQSDRRREIKIKQTYIFVYFM
jgi:hypothetical protein